MNSQNQRWLAIIFLMLALALAACTSAPAKPTVTVALATTGAVIENQEVVVTVLANDSKGIARIELTADNTIVSVANLNPAPKSVSAPMTWKSSSGQHTLAARALNVENVLSDPASLLLTVAPSPAPTAAPTIAPLPTALATQAPAPTAAPQPVPPTATAIPIPPTPVPCTNVLTFIADVTVPDGTAWAPNQGFNKIWRVRNDGSCAWNNTYQFVFVGGTQMSGARQIAVPNTNPGATADLLITMVAPPSYGSYSGSWQMRAPNGLAFGTALYVNIRVINPNPPPPPTAIPPQPVTRRNVTGLWVYGEWSADLNEAVGCASTVCPIMGKLTHGIFPTPELYDLAGTINVSTGAVSFYPTVPGGPTFSGTVSADSRTMAGTLTSVGYINFAKQ